MRESLRIVNRCETSSPLLCLRKPSRFTASIPVRLLSAIPPDPPSDFGQSYASSSLEKASEYYDGEIECVNTAAQVARKLGAKESFVLSVGATPTAHAATQTSATGQMGLEGELEL